MGSGTWREVAAVPVLAVPIHMNSSSAGNESLQLSPSQVMSHHHQDSTHPQVIVHARGLFEGVCNFRRSLQGQLSSPCGFRHLQSRPPRSAHPLKLSGRCKQKCLPPPSFKGITLLGSPSLKVSATSGDSGRPPEVADTFKEGPQADHSP